MYCKAQYLSKVMKSNARGLKVWVRFKTGVS
jgi:hypothetical protein